MLGIDQLTEKSFSRSTNLTLNIKQTDKKKHKNLHLKLPRLPRV